jgi:hypothetical protein
MRFCPGCGLNTAEVGDRSGPAVSDRADPYVDTIDPASGAAAPTPTHPDAPTRNDSRPVGTDASRLRHRFVDRGSRGTPFVVGALIVAAGLVAFGLLTRPQPGAPPAALPGGEVATDGTAVGSPALIVGLTIQSPRDGQTVATKEVTVIGIAPPGLKITRDVSFGLDQHATADGTGHWAINVGLDQGENKLKFRIGDDRSTEQELRVTYTPQAP